MSPGNSVFGPRKHVWDCSSTRVTGELLKKFPKMCPSGNQKGDLNVEPLAGQSAILWRGSFT